jgi:hypothetical protein
MAAELKHDSAADRIAGVATTPASHCGGAVQIAVGVHDQGRARSRAVGPAKVMQHGLNPVGIQLEHDSTADVSGEATRVLAALKGRAIEVSGSIQQQPA